MAGAAAAAKGAEGKASPAGEGEAGDAPRRGGKKKLLLIALPVLLIGIGAAVYFLVFAKSAPPADQVAAEGAESETRAPRPPARPPVFLDMPEIVANLNTGGGRRAAYVKLRSKLEIAQPEDAGPIQTAMPRLLDLFTTYLREMRPEELRGSLGTMRLREELLARANVALANSVPVGQPQPRVTDVLFLEILQQ